MRCLRLATIINDDIEKLRKMSTDNNPIDLLEYWLREAIARSAPSVDIHDVKIRKEIAEFADQIRALQRTPSKRQR